MINNSYNLVTILGPTASGKTSVAAHLAKRLGSCVISADSRQVYRNMSIGTGKDLNDYIIDGQQIPYELIDILDAGEKFNVFGFQQEFIKIFSKYQSQGKIPVMCGGTGLYIESVLKSYQLHAVPVNHELRDELENKSFEELIEKLFSYKTPHNKSDFDTKKRLIRAIEIEDFQQGKKPEIQTSQPVSGLIIGIHFERQVQKERITERLHSRLKEGMIDEVRSLLGNGLSAENLIYYGLEYKFITKYLLGELSYEQMVQQLNIAIHQFSKRQMTWFRKMEREGFKIHWLDGFLPVEKKVEIIMTLMEKDGN